MNANHLFLLSLGQLVCWYVIRSNVDDDGQWVCLNFFLSFECFYTYVKCAKVAWARARARARAYKYIVAIVHGVWFYQTKPSFCIFCGSEKLPEPINSEGDERWPLIRSGLTPFPGPFTPPPPPWLDAFWFMKFESGVIPNSPTIGIELGWSIGPNRFHVFEIEKCMENFIKILLKSNFSRRMKFFDSLDSLSIYGDGSMNDARDTHLMHWMALVRLDHDPEIRMERRHVNGMVDHRSQIRIFLHGQNTGTPPRLGRPVTSSLEIRAFFVHHRKKGHDPYSSIVSFAVLSTVCFGTKPKSVQIAEITKERTGKKKEMSKEITIEGNETNIPNQSKQIANAVIKATNSISIIRYNTTTAAATTPQ